MTTNPFQSQSLNDWLFYLEQQHPTEIELGLERINQVAERAKVKDLGAKKTVLVAGTNGKGTTIRFIEHALISMGYSVGVFSSPHIHKYNERVRINGEMLSDDAHIEAFDYIEQYKAGTSLTYFEFSTLASYRIFQTQQLDFVLIEVGLGGRLDSTNIVEQDISVITSIGLDHTDWLGDTKEQIAFEKAGIFKPNTTSVIGEPIRYNSIQQQAEQHQVAQVLWAGRDYHYEVCGQVASAEPIWQYDNGVIKFESLKSNYVPTQNIATAITVLLEMGLSLEQAQLNELIANFSLPGRMQLLSEKPIRLVDVAHNPHAVEYLIKVLRTRTPFNQCNKIIAVVAMMRDKDITQTLQLIAPYVSEWHLGALPKNQRAASTESIKAILEGMGEYNITTYPDIKMAWAGAEQNQPDETLLLGFGSFYTVADILDSQ
ncbi:bifunctional tetrahydrofolate synthase/dihydrofolate synthase [Psychrosphaera ytuae]|uniref:Dihydrofolate synthase/folylpolyglutamate synthase n=1 Tax=Psychrosphaera ytuae TaxID=2820710 RepID=A0A975DCK8_9GAMM|nr:bifunctional tetrahydrofolate synthase/dihydrofolate synthase [Psychrosphaera ytuae]QTH63866.1 bifunctional tetrahydrofolate synthase/dihydrofolate synthase [Psychrosphaera ytuae]